LSSSGCVPYEHQSAEWTIFGGGVRERGEGERGGRERNSMACDKCKNWKERVTRNKLEETSREILRMQWEERK
jgi:hypothetical protein